MGATIDYIIYAKYINPQSGNLARIFLRRYDCEKQRGETIFIDTPVDFVIPSYEFKKEESENVKTSLENVLKNNKNFDKDIRFEIKQFDSYRSVIHAYLPDKKKEKRESLRKIAKAANLSSNFFIINKMSPSQYLMSQFQPFTIPESYSIEPPFISRNTKGVVSLEDIKNDVHVALDIETENWDKKDIQDIISMMVMVSNKKDLPKFIFTRYDPCIEYVNGYKIVSFKNHEELRENIHYVLRNIYKPLSIVGFNQYFDQIMLRLCIEDYEPGIDETQPKVRSASGKTKSIMIRGLQAIDLFNKFSYELPYLKDNKLESIMQHFNFPFAKSINYFDLVEAFNEAERGNKEKLIKSLEYTANDGDATISLFLDVIDEIYTDALCMNSLPESICKGFDGNADEWWRRQFFLIKNTLLNRYKYKYIPRLDTEQYERTFYSIKIEEKLEKDSRGHDKKIVVLPRKDVYFNRAALVFSTLLLQALDPLYEVHPEIRNYWHYYKKTPISLIGKKYRGLFKLQSRMCLPLTFYDEVCTLFDLKPEAIFPENIPPIYLKKQMILSFDTKNNEFKISYGNLKCDLRQINKSLVENVELWNSIVKEEHIINYSNKLLLLDEVVGEELSDKRLGIIIAKGPAISVENRFFLYEHNTIYMQGISLTRNDKSKWEQKLILELLKEALIYIQNNSVFDEAGRKKVRERYESELEKLARNEVKKSELLFVKPQIKKNIKIEDSQGVLFDLGLTSSSQEEEKEESKKNKKKKINYYVGFLKGVYYPVPKDEFLESNREIDVTSYKSHFQKAYSSIINIIM